MSLLVRLIMIRSLLGLVVLVSTFSVVLVDGLLLLTNFFMMCIWLLWVWLESAL